MSFLLQIGSGPAVPFAALGLTNLKRRIRSQNASSFSFTAAGFPCDADPLAPEGVICSVFSSEFLFFSGRLHRIPRKGSGGAESIDYQILDAWHDFERNVYQQQWNLLTGHDENGNPTTTTQFRSECNPWDGP